MKDLYDRESKILSIKKKFKETCQRCFSILEDFERDLKLNNYSIGRIEKYWSILKRIHNMIGCFEKANRKDIEDFVITVDNNKKWSEWKKRDFKYILKFFQMVDKKDNIRRLSRDC